MGELKADELSLGFPRESLIFLNYLKEPQSLAKLKQKLSEFFSWTLESVDIKLVLVDEKQREVLDFKTSRQLKEHAKRTENQARREQILQDPVVKKLEEVFETKVEQVFLTEKK